MVTRIQRNTIFNTFTKIRQFREILRKLKSVPQCVTWLLPIKLDNQRTLEQIVTKIQRNSVKKLFLNLERHFKILKICSFVRYC